ncbi:hypothetical protein [Acetobacter nitrogenifigens]|uniref:Uncharacterized protein n=1 Tax=Acetobacter nitrogenifigens DSM 23921 = NBRC 105050 TaxID=1120919 RepID=A0A511X9L6_9PROT|nr:hypothetical protein [Acetobacter nitrogenifigens]GEN59643.1 hypothetical protein ANI02nite_15270 [Acetobacter nitrogenifigens DSM 23921 = NBRC 105050]
MPDRSFENGLTTKAFWLPPIPLSRRGGLGGGVADRRRPILPNRNAVLFLKSDISSLYGQPPSEAPEGKRMEWHGFVALMTFLFLSIFAPLLIALVILWRNALDEGWAERDARFREVILRRPGLAPHAPSKTQQRKVQ